MGEKTEYKYTLMRVVPAGEVFVAVEKAGSSVQRVPGVVDGRALWISAERGNT